MSPRRKRLIFHTVRVERGSETQDFLFRAHPSPCLRPTSWKLGKVSVTSYCPFPNIHNSAPETITILLCKSQTRGGKEGVLKKISLGTSIRNANQRSFWIVGRQRENHPSHLSEQEPRGMSSKSRSRTCRLEPRSHWGGQVRCTRRSYLVWLCAGHSLWEDAEHVPVQRQASPQPTFATNSVCFPEPSSSYKILSCSVIALLTADNVSHFIIHTGKGVYKSCLQEQSGTSESWLEGLLPPCHVLILRTCSNSSVFITASAGSY